MIWPLDTWRGFRGLGFNLLFSFLAMIVLHAALSLPTRSVGPSWRYPNVHALLFQTRPQLHP